MAETVRIAGIDPGLRTTGFGVINYNLEKNEIWASNCGLVKTPVRFKGTDAILYMIEHLQEVSQRDCFRDCEKVVVEFPAAFYNPKFSAGSLTPLAAISGACMVLFQNDSKKKILPIYPTVWNGGKKKVNTSKRIQEVMGCHSEWEYDDTPTRSADFEHIIDAIGMAYWLTERDYFETRSEG